MVSKNSTFCLITFVLEFHSLPNLNYMPLHSRLSFEKIMTEDTLNIKICVRTIIQLPTNRLLQGFYIQQLLILNHRILQNSREIGRFTIFEHQRTKNISFRMPVKLRLSSWKLWNFRKKQKYEKTPKFWFHRIDYTKVNSKHYSFLYANAFAVTLCKNFEISKE